MDSAPLTVRSLNEPYSTLSTSRRYEVWFLRFGLKDGRGAWWLRYLLMNPGREGCPGSGMPAQLWATWFPSSGAPQSFIQGFPSNRVGLSGAPFSYTIGQSVVGEDFCRGELQSSGHSVSWDLRYCSTFRFTMSAKGWIGFTRTPHSDAVVSGFIRFDGVCVEGEPLGFGVQGHNCGYRHRKFWTWTHAFFERPNGPPSTLEALVYEMPFGFVFRRAVLWHDGQQHVFRHIWSHEGENDGFHWRFRDSNRQKLGIDAKIDGSGPSIHTLPYLKTDCAGTFPVMNNSRAKARLLLMRRGGAIEILETADGAVLERAGGLTC
jgi:hypothetical protein